MIDTDLVWGLMAFTYCVGLFMGMLVMCWYEDKRR